MFVAVGGRCANDCVFMRNANSIQQHHCGIRRVLGVILHCRWTGRHFYALLVIFAFILRPNYGAFSDSTRRQRAALHFISWWVCLDGGLLMLGMKWTISWNAEHANAYRLAGAKGCQHAPQGVSPLCDIDFIVGKIRSPRGIMSPCGNKHTSTSHRCYELRKTAIHPTYALVKWKKGSAACSLRGTYKRHVMGTQSNDVKVISQRNALLGGGKLFDQLFSMS